jgi:hypothetical protein
VVRLYPLLSNGSVNTHSRVTEEKCFPWGPCQGVALKTIDARGISTRSTEEYKQYKAYIKYKQYNKVQWRKRMTTERVLVICEVCRLVIAL